MRRRLLQATVGFTLLCLVALQPNPSRPVTRQSGIVPGPISWSELGVRVDAQRRWWETVDAQSRWFAAAATRPARVSVPRRSGTVGAAATGVWDSLVACEASGDWAANTANGFEGGLQFTHSTWVAYGGREFAEHAYDASRAQQIVVAERVLAGQGWGAWPSCSRKLGLR